MAATKNAVARAGCSPSAARCDTHGASRAEAAALAARGPHARPRRARSAPMCRSAPNPGRRTCSTRCATRACGCCCRSPGTPGPLHWAEFTGADALCRAPFGLREPAAPHLPPEAVSDGRPWSWCPRSRSTAAGCDSDAARASTTGPSAWPTPDARLVAVVRDDELVDELPEEPHDVAWAGR